MGPAGSSEPERLLHVGVGDDVVASLRLGHPSGHRRLPRARRDRRAAAALRLVTPAAARRALRRARSCRPARPGVRTCRVSDRRRGTPAHAARRLPRRGSRRAARGRPPVGATPRQRPVASEESPTISHCRRLGALSRDGGAPTSASRSAAANASSGAGTASDSASPSTRIRLQDDLTVLFALHRARWGEGSPFLRFEAFHREFAAVALERGWLRLWFLELDDRPAAAWYGFRFAGVESYYQAGRDPSAPRRIARLRPARALDSGGSRGRHGASIACSAVPRTSRRGSQTRDPGLETFALGRGMRATAARVRRGRGAAQRSRARSASGGCPRGDDWGSGRVESLGRRIARSSLRARPRRSSATTASGRRTCASIPASSACEPRCFASQLELLSAPGFEFVTVAELRERVAGDGATARPRRAQLRRRHGRQPLRSSCRSCASTALPATVYVTTGLIGKPNPWMAPGSGARMMNEDELRELAAAGVEIGAHTRHASRSVPARLRGVPARDHREPGRARTSARNAGAHLRLSVLPLRPGGAARPCGTRASRAAVTCQGLGSWERLELKRSLITGKDRLPIFLLKLTDRYHSLFESAPSRVLRAVTRGWRDRRRTRIDERMDVL